MGEPIITPEAAADIEEAWDYLSRRNLTAADRLLSSAKMQAQFPLMGQQRDEISPGLRCFIVRPYVGFYRVEAENIRVLRFLHGRRDVKRVMGSEP